MTDDGSAPAAVNEGSTREDGEQAEEPAPPEEQVDPLTRVEEVLEKIRTKEDEEDLGPLLSELDDIEDVLDEAEDLLSTMDVSELVHAVDWESLPDAVDVSALPDVVEDGNVGDAIEGRELLSAVDLSALFDNVDEREFWRQKREFDEEFEDVTGGGSDEPSEEVVGFDGEVDREGMGHDVDPRAIQATVQREIAGAVGEFREKLIEAHHRLAEIREANEERFDERRTSRDSRNPTAGFSTVSPNPTGGHVAGRYAFSTVPEETRYSSAPNRERIYGRRFEAAGGDDRE